MKSDAHQQLTLRNFNSVQANWFKQYLHVSQPQAQNCNAHKIIHIRLMAHESKAKEGSTN